MIRFDDGRVEAEMVTRGMPGGIAPVGDPGAPSLAELPATTAAAFTVSFRDGWLDEWVTSLGDVFGGGAAGGGSEDLWKDLEAGTGLQLPEDLETLLGDGLRVSVDGTVDVGALSSADVPQAPVGVRIHGDDAEITRVVDTLLAQVPPGEADALVRSRGDGYVVLGLDQAYVDQLAGSGGLGDVPAFRDVVPEPDRVAGGVFVNFDAEDWATRVAREVVPGRARDRGQPGAARRARPDHLARRRGRPARSLPPQHRLTAATGHFPTCLAGASRVKWPVSGGWTPPSRGWRRPGRRGRARSPSRAVRPRRTRWRWSSADASTTVGCARFWPSGEIPPTT